ncbi:hypothetical protein EDB80DRAFT_415281, partial [Ilyonectria destructans]
LTLTITITTTVTTTTHPQHSHSSLHSVFKQLNQPFKMKFISIALPFLAAVAMAAPALQETNNAVVARDEVLLFDRLVADISKRNDELVEREQSDLIVKLGGTVVNGLLKGVTGLVDGLVKGLGVDGLLGSLTGSLKGLANKRDEAAAAEGGALGAISIMVAALAEQIPELKSASAKLTAAVEEIEGVAATRLGSAQ